MAYIKVGDIVHSVENAQRQIALGLLPHEYEVVGLGGECARLRSLTGEREEYSCRLGLLQKIR